MTLSQAMQCQKNHVMGFRSNLMANISFKLAQEEPKGQPRPPGGQPELLNALQILHTLTRLFLLLLTLVAGK